MRQHVTFGPRPITDSIITSTTIPGIVSTITTVNFPVSQQWNRNHSSHDVSGVTTSDSRLQLVDSLYGPGTVGCWLLIICSVILSWTLNPRQSKRDYITNEFIASLAFPCIASTHLAFVLHRLPASLLEVLTSTDPEMLQHSAAIAAPLNICETFTILALLLFAITAWRRQVKRAALILTVGILSWASVNSVLLESHAENTQQLDIHAGDSLSEKDMMIIAWTIFSIIFTLIVILFVLILCALTYALARTLSIAWMRSTAVMCALCTPVAVLMASFTGRVLVGGTREIGEGVTLASQPFFIPRTNVSVLSLDQLVTLTGGSITLLFSAFEAIKEWSLREDDREGSSVNVAVGRHGIGSEQHTFVQRRNSI